MCNNYRFGFIKTGFLAHHYRAVVFSGACGQQPWTERHKSSITPREQEHPHDSLVTSSIDGDVARHAHLTSLIDFRGIFLSAVYTSSQVVDTIQHFDMIIENNNKL